MWSKKHPVGQYALLALIGLLFAAGLTLPLSANALSQPIELTQEGTVVLGLCESGNNPTVRNGLGLFDGEHQWLQSTWDAATAGAGFPEYVGVSPADVAQAIQYQVTQYWWAVSTPSTQWPNCYDDVFRFYGLAAPCLGHNVISCNVVATGPSQVFAG